ncbi:MAG: glycosyltransferase family 2 protein, partial [Phycisphaerae bacterium]|nr:glycosyltransferase family 2 protein [Phycisphaerae bacterium]
MSHTPSVSVITPCRNAADTLQATVAGVQAQSRADWELLCVDDGSTDDTRSLLDRLAAADSRIRVLSTPAGGAAAARNAACRQAHGQYILFLDADDTMRPDALDVLLHAASLAGPRTLVVAGHELMDHDGHPLGRYHFPSVPEFTLDVLLRGNRLPPMTLIPA